MRGLVEGVGLAAVAMLTVARTVLASTHASLLPSTALPGTTVTYDNGFPPSGIPRFVVVFRAGVVASKRWLAHRR